MAKILVADDDLFYRNLVADSLVAMGHEVTKAADGNEALQEWLLSEQPFDCLVLDVYMDKITGLDLLEKIREITAITNDRKKRAPVIIMTSDEKVETELEARRKKAFSFLIKPFSLDQLERAVNKVLLKR